MKTIEEIYEQKAIEKAIDAVGKHEQKRRSMPDPKLTEFELGVLKGIIEGRNSDEIQVAIKLINPNDSYTGVVHRLRRKFDAFTLAHAVYKAAKLGIV